ncbi:MAG: hypothetical protein LBE13_22275, partial [Bacteroidales bacterium]|nr:hypothetical protein [Bacteroidales bacterium]
VFFFKDIAAHSSFEEYNILLNNHIDSEEKLAEDITSQIYSISRGLNMKYKKLKAVGFIVAGEFILLAGWVIIFLITK